MGQIWVKEFIGGLDSRRLPEATKGGTLLVAKDGHINRGGEFEQRAAFVKVYDLPAGSTKGLANLKTQLVVFGKDAAPAGMPVGVTYQQIVHPVTPTLDLNRVLSWEYFANAIYCAAQFEDGSIYHYYDGVRVPDYDEKRARVTLNIITGGSGGVISEVTVDGVNILGTPVSWVDSTSATAEALANQINSYLSSPDYTAVAYQNRVAILAATHGTAYNGLAVAVTAVGITYTQSAAALSGGSDGAGSVGSALLTLTAGSGTDTVTSIKVGGVEILGTAVAFNTNLSTTATLIAQQINATAETPEYAAVAVGAAITISTALVGAAWNDLVITYAVTGGMTFTVGGPIAGGVDVTYQSGAFVKTGNQKMFALTESEMHFSGIKQPTKWISQNATGAGFIDMSNEASNTEVLTSMAKYQRNYAIFAPRSIQVWYNDPDPANNVQTQVLNNTGTTCPRSVTQYGDNDLFYVDESGIRSLKARDASNAAATTDIGVPIDTLVIDALQSISFDDRQNVIGLTEPSSGRYWAVFKDQIFVFSFFREASVSAWSLYKPGFTISDAIVFNRKVYVRSGDSIYVYGGLGAKPTYDDTEAEAWLPYMDGGTPTTKKTLLGVDVACRGVWELRVGAIATDEEASDLIGTVVDTTYFGPDMPAVGESTHFQLRAKLRKGVDSETPAVLSSAVLHFTPGSNDA